MTGNGTRRWRAAVPSAATPVPTVAVTRAWPGGSVEVESGRAAGVHPPPSHRGDRPRRRGPSARLRIMGWLVLLLAVALVSVVLVTRNLLITASDGEITAALRQEVEEFEQFAREGRNPETGQPFTAAEQLLQVHLARQRTADNEVLVGISTRPGVSPLLQGQADTVRAFDGPGELDAFVGGSAASGTMATAAGDLRWARVPVRLGDVVGGYFVVGHLVEPERAEIDLTVRTLTVVGLLGLLMAAAAAWIVAGQILSPVRLLHRTAAAISEHDLTRRIPSRGTDDITALAEQFNAMLDRLQSAFGSQRAFLDDVSHELRTPITIVRCNLELLGDDPAERAEDVRLCLDELDRMSRMVEDLLLLAKSERPDFLRWESVELAELTSDIDAKVRALGPRHWQLEEVAEGVARVDPHRITQAVVALAYNAVEHTAAGDAISFGSAVRHGRLSCWITDSGPGVAAEDAATLFDRFVRGSTRTNRAGAGLGLAIVAAIADAHGGVARLRSTPGQGSTFTVEIPVLSPAAPNRRPE